MSPRELGTASSSVTFFRSLGGTIGVSAMGSVLGSTVASLLTDKSDALKAAIAKLGKEGIAIAQAMQSGTIPNVSSMPNSVRTIIESVYGESVAHVFLIAAPLAIITIIAVALIPNNRLGTKTALERMAESAPGESAAVIEAEGTIFDISEAMVAGASTASVADERRSEETGGSSGL